jgi:RHS repeat-associated protein
MTYPGLGVNRILTLTSVLGAGPEVVSFPMMVRSRQSKPGAGRPRSPSTTSPEREYNVFMWYRRGWGRCTQEDRMRSRTGRNLFAYVDGNPVQVIDSRGLKPSALSATVPPSELDFKLKNCQLCKEFPQDFLAHNRFPIFTHSGKTGVSYANTICSDRWPGTHFTDSTRNAGGCVQKCVIFHENVHRRECIHGGDPESETESLHVSVNCAVRHTRQPGGRGTSPPARHSLAVGDAMTGFSIAAK